jgi:hypothetical protein
MNDLRSSGILFVLLKAILLFFFPSFPSPAASSNTLRKTVSKYLSLHHRINHLK